MNAQEILKSSIDDLVYEGRNKVYGGYILRKIYGNQLGTGVVIAVSIFVLMSFAPLISVKKNLLKVDDGTIVIYDPVILPPPTPTPPPPPKPPPPPMREQVAIVAPIVKPDNQVQVEVPLITEVKDNVDIGPKKIKGVEDGLARGVSTEATAAKVKEIERVEPKPVEDTKPIIFVEQMPVFADGEAALFKYLKENINYPAIARENNISGTVVIGFVVAKDGSITDIKVKKGIAGGCTDEAIRVISNMPKWKPGKQNGREVAVYFTLPVRFQLD
jgi:periplasmic protein TonB